MMHEWNDFYVAVTGAAGALTGLIFVGVSINLKKILPLPTLPNRALISLILLITILTFAILQLVPGETLKSLGYQVIIIGFIAWAIVTTLDIKIFRLTKQPWRRYYILNMRIDQIALIPYLMGGICLLSIGETSLYWFVPAIILSFIKSVLDAWVLLIEIHQ
ncbi:MAG: hypothetical protein ACHQF0_00500 [Chitinophagales bacterium]